MLATPRMLMPAAAGPSRTQSDEDIEVEEDGGQYDVANANVS